MCISTVVAVFSVAVLYSDTIQTIHHPTFLFLNSKKIRATMSPLGTHTLTSMTKSRLTQDSTSSSSPIDVTTVEEYQ